MEDIGFGWQMLKNAFQSRLMAEAANESIVFREKKLGCIGWKCFRKIEK